MKNLINYTERQDNIRKVGSNPEIKVIVKEDSVLQNLNSL